jgi:hypothetical protein
MRSLVAVVAALSLVAVSTCEANAKAQPKVHKHHAKWYYPDARPNVYREPKYPTAAGWYPHDSNKLPFGSAIWWEQMRRDGRLGGETP